MSHISLMQPTYTSICIEIKAHSLIISRELTSVKSSLLISKLIFLDSMDPGIALDCGNARSRASSNRLNGY